MAGKVALASCFWCIRSYVITWHGPLSPAVWQHLAPSMRPSGVPTPGEIKWLILKYAKLGKVLQLPFQMKCMKITHNWLDNYRNLKLEASALTFISDKTFLLL